VFETAVLRKHGQGFVSVDAGLIAETLLFYSNIHVVAHYGVLQDLLRTIGADTLLRLVEDKTITFTYLRTDYGTVTTNQNGIEFNAFLAMHIGGTAAGQNKINTRESIYLAFERALGRSAKTHRLATRFLSNIKILKDIKVPSHPNGVPGLADADLDDPTYVQDAIKSSLVELVPTYTPPANFRFGILRSSSGFLIDHNIDLGELNKLFKRSFPSSDCVITPGLLITQILEARVNLLLTSQYMAELVTNPATASIVRRKLAALMEKRDKSVSDLEMFQSTRLHDARAIREAINSGEYTFDEFMLILEKATKFKDWLRTRNPDGNLLDEYYKSVMAETWLNNLPAKTVRFLIAAGVAAMIEALFPSGLGVATGLGLEAADHLLLDRLFRGWRPNQFVEGPLQEFSS
jgi:hypothetical protein